MHRKFVWWSTNPFNRYNSPSTHLLYVILVTCFDLSPFCLTYDLSVSDTGEPAKEVVVLLTVPVHRNRAGDKLDFWIEFVLHLWKYVFTITWWVYGTWLESVNLYIKNICCWGHLYMTDSSRIPRVPLFFLPCHVVLPLMFWTLLSTIVISITYVFFHAWLLPFLFI